MENEVSQCRLLRLSQVLKLIPVSKSTWLLGVRTGRFPKPIKLGPAITCWYYQDLQPLIEKPAQAPDPVEAAPAGHKARRTRAK